MPNGQMDLCVSKEEPKETKSHDHDNVTQKVCVDQCETSEEPKELSLPKKDEEHVGKLKKEKEMDLQEEKEAELKEEDGEDEEEEKEEEDEGDDEERNMMEQMGLPIDFGKADCSTRGVSFV